MSKIFVTGASGFIARNIIATLLKNGHEVVGCARNTSFVKTVFPDIKVIAADFFVDTDPSVWEARLEGIDVIVNCVGVFQMPNPKDTWAAHYDAPRALFEAAEKTGVKKIVHLSALGIAHGKQPYSLSKLKIEDYLTHTNTLDSTILRPSFVYGPGSHGGSSLFRGFAGMPFILPLPGKATQRFQPIHIEDLARVVHESITLSGKKMLTVVGPETLSLRTILNTLRAWLGFKKVINIPVPFFLIKLLGKLGDRFADSPVNTTAVELMQYDNVASPQEAEQFMQSISFTPRGFTEALLTSPSQVQDRWHARLYFAKPLLRYSLAFIWLWTAFVVLFIYPHKESYDLLSQMGATHPVWQGFLLYGGCLLNAALGCLILLNYKIKLIGGLSIAVMLLYTGVITFYLPALWWQPFIPVAKNIPLIVATLIMMALEPDR
jgi:nucleoside-diphosphate-sugar epimerase